MNELLSPERLKEIEERDRHAGAIRSSSLCYLAARDRRALLQHISAQQKKIERLEEREAHLLEVLRAVDSFCTQTEGELDGLPNGLWQAIRAALNSVEAGEGGEE